MRWEYAVMDVEFDGKKRQWLAWHGGQQRGHLELLNHMGNEGWELVVAQTIDNALVTGTPHSLYFKRPKP
jgi:hypothetical protein